MCVKQFFKLCDLRLFATEILRRKCKLSRFGFTSVFFLKNLTLFFWRLKAIRRKLHFKENLFIAKSIKMHSCKNLLLCYYFKYFILFSPKKLIQDPVKNTSFIREQLSF